MIGRPLDAIVDMFPFFQELSEMIWHYRTAAILHQALLLPISAGNDMEMTLGSLAPIRVGKA
jgi:hypothetical protein